jgi:thioredoxin reductase (NADPH)
MVVYKLLVVGCGPAGLTAGIYAARYGVDCLMVGRDYGLAGEAYLVENYPGFQSIGGLELADRMFKHLASYGVPVKFGEEVSKISRSGENFSVELSGGEKLEVQAVIYAAGSRHRRLEVPGESRLLGKGVSYCATCDGPLYRGKTVAVVGGSNSAAQSALLLAEHSSKVYILYRRERLRCEPILAERIEKNDKIETVYKVVPVELVGDQKLETVVLRRSDGETFRLDVAGVFVEIGIIPNVEPVKGLGVELDEEGRIKVKPDQSTNVEGFFAAGNVTDGSSKLDQIVTAAAEGAVAATSAYRYLKEKIKRK